MPHRPPTADLLGVVRSLGPDRIVATHTSPPQAAEFADWPTWASPEFVAGYRALGIDRPWRHQVEAADAAWFGRHTVLATATGSGKSLAMWLPVLSTIQSARTGLGGATALYLAPTKALAADQLAALERTIAAAGVPGILPATCDGDTGYELRGWVQAHSAAVLTNPDFLHHVLLPGHRRWARLFRHLRYVIVDEAHAYRGLFGAHVALILRRLARVARGYGADPTFLLASATAAEPGPTAARLIGANPDEVVVVATDTAPHAETTYVLWEPPLIPGFAPLEEADDPWAVDAPLPDDAGPVAVAPLAPVRRSARSEVARLLADLVAAGARVLAFGRARRLVELVASAARSHLAEAGDPYADRIAAYRGGYLPEERRELESAIRSGDLRALATTNALELGVDISGLDAVLLTGWPGTRASFRQQSGRAGRAGASALVVLVGDDNPLDTYLLHHPDAIFGPEVEASVFDPTNPWVLAPHLCAAAAEAPLTTDDLATFGLSGTALLDELVADGYLRRRASGWFWTRPDRPTDLADLRGSGGRQVQLVETGTGTLLGTVNRSTADATVHTGAVYLHQGRTYLVDGLDLDESVAWVTPTHVPYTTSAYSTSSITILGTDRAQAWGPVRWGYGPVEVTSQVTHFSRLRLPDLQVLDSVRLDMDPHALVTSAVWWTVPTAELRAAGIGEQTTPGALHAAEHAMIALLPLLATCDRWDLGGVSTALHPETGTATVFVHDAYAGGAGFAERGYAMAAMWLRATRDAIATCECVDGCPSCIQSPKCGNGNEPLDKSGALALLNLVLADAPE